jgi:hypothetical protein
MNVVSNLRSEIQIPFAGLDFPFLMEKKAILNDLGWLLKVEIDFCYFELKVIDASTNVPNSPPDLVLLVM